jgi:carbon monoxide dehydrogenase subunit G
MGTLIHTRTARAAVLAAALAVSSPWAGGLFAADRPLSVHANPAAQVSVTSGDAGVYRVEGSFCVEAPVPVAWAVLTDYDKLSSFVSSMRSSVSSRGPSGRLLVIQEAVGRAGPFKRTLNVVLDVSEEPPARIVFQDVSGGSFHSYIGSWTIEPDTGGGIRVTYVLDARPRSAPRLFGRSILASNAKGLLEEVRLEMVRRSPTASAN